MVYSRAWGKLIHEKTRSKKSRDTVPLSQNVHKIVFKVHLKPEKHLKYEV